MADIFYKLLEMSISASWLIAVVIVLRLFFKRIPRKIVCCLWALVALRLVCPFTIESSLSLVPDVSPISFVSIDNSADGLNAAGNIGDANSDLTGEPMDGIADGNIVDAADGLAGGLTAGTADNTMSGSTGTTSNMSNASTNTSANTSTGTSASNLTNASAGGSTGITSNTVSGTLSSAFTVGASVVWLAGVAVLLIYALVTYIRVRRRTLASVNMEGNIYLCDDIDTPFILGVFRTKIFIPSSLSVGERGYVLAHERAHLKRLDNIWKPLGYVILAVYWFNPLVWISYILLCRDIEIACDERVISDKDMEYKKQYATTLLNCSADRSYVTACPLAFGEVGVKQRIRAVLNYKKPAFWVVIAAVVVCVAAAVGFMTNPSSKKDSGENVADSTSENETSGEIESVTEAQTETQTEVEQETGSEEESSTQDIIPARAVNCYGWHVWVHERENYKYYYDTAQLTFNDGENRLYLTAFDLQYNMYSYDELKENENLSAWTIVQYDGTLEEYTENSGVGLSIYRYEERLPITSDGTPGTGYMLIYGESGNNIVWYMIMPVGMTLDEVRDFASDIYVEPGNAFGTLSYLEQYERIVNKEGFLSSYTDSGDSVFDLYADELMVKRPEKYEQLKNSADAVCMLYDIDEESREVFHDNVGRETVLIHTTSGEDFIVAMRLRGELWQPWMTPDSKNFNYEYYREREAQLKAVSAEELRALDDEINPLESIILGTGDGWIALAKLDDEDTVLYGDHSGSSVVLRHEDKVIPISLSYLSTRISVPLFYSGDFDNDGATEYSIWVCVLTGTGISCDQLYMIETDWNEAEDGSIEYSISEYQAYYQNREVMKIDCQYDKESKLLSVAYDGEEIDTADLTKLFEQYPGEYVGVYFGDSVSFTYNAGQWYYETVGGITRKNSGMVNYQYSVHLRGRVVYDGHNFGLDDVEVWTVNQLDEIN